MPDLNKIYYIILHFVLGGAILNFIKDVFKGICIGAGAILPGVSSGVLCVIFGIYDKLINSVLNISKDFKNNFLFLLPICIGAFLGIILLGKLLSFLFASFPMPTKYAFIGLILGSIPILIKQLNSNNKFKKSYLFFTVISFIFGVSAVVLENIISQNSINDFSLAQNLYQTQVPSIVTIIFLMTSGFFMSIGIVVPRDK